MWNHSDRIVILSKTQVRELAFRISRDVEFHINKF